jgi:hypothetical protein
MVHWHKHEGQAVQVSVATPNNVWVVNSTDDIYNWDGHHWKMIPGKLTNISVGHDGAVWGVNRAGEIYKYTGSGWEPRGSSL